MDVEKAVKLAAWHKTNYIAPHEYIVYRNNPEAFGVLAEQIDKNGVKEKFLGRTYKYWYFGVHKYWRIKDVINRVKA